MTFVSIPFLCLFIITVAFYWAVKSLNGRHIILLIASYVFYAWWDYRLLVLLVVQTLISYGLGLAIDRSSDVKAKKRLCALGVTLSLLILGFFKYFGFFVESMILLFKPANYRLFWIILPVGISFYTFQAISYIVDVYRGVINAKKDFVSVALYISFFPQLVAGPIVRAKDFLPQLEFNHEITLANVEAGAQIFAIGMLKKVVVADRLAVCVDAVFKNPSAYDAPTLICAAVAYLFQIYCDFSGYSDMAIGTARVFGYELCKNFDLPYLSKNLSEFWKRWHISLSSWLMDYLYIPLGGNRKGKIRTYINLMLTMILGGLWHGANWTYIVWGVFHGIGLCLHRLYKAIVGKKISDKISGKIIEKYIIVPISMLLTTCYFGVSQIIFRAQTISDAKVFIKGILTWQSGVHYIYVYTIIYAVIITIVHVIQYVKNDGHYKYFIMPLNTWKGKFLFCMELMVIFLFAYGGNTAFVYFQF